MKILKKIKYLSEYVLIISLFKLGRIIGLEMVAQFICFWLKKIKNFLPFTKIARINIDLIYDFQLSKREELIDKIYDNFGRFVAEVGALRSMSLDEIRGKVTINGMEHIEHFKKENRPFLIFTGHLANWEMVLSVLTQIYPDSAAVYRKNNNPYINDMICKQREIFGISLIPKGPQGGKVLFKALRDKKTIAMLVDQKMKEGISIPFMGHEAMTSDGIAKVALGFNYPIVPLQIVRIGGGSNFHVNIFPPLEFEKQSKEEDTIRNIVITINQILESWINQNPDQWLWFHRRWKIKY